MCGKPGGRGERAFSLKEEWKMEEFEERLMELIEEAFDNGAETDEIISALELRIYALKEQQ